MPKNFAQTPHFIFAKLLRFQGTFLEKSLVSGFGADSPNRECARKNAEKSAFFILSGYVGTAFQTLLQEAFCKKPLENPQKLPSVTPLHFSKAFEVPRDFLRKVPCAGVWGDAPTDNARKKHGIAVLFISTYF